MAADAWKVYNTFRNKVVTGNIKLDADTIKQKLYLAASNCADATRVKIADLTNEVAGTYGYVEKTLTVTVTNPSAAIVMWDSTTNPVQTASGGSIVCRYAVIYDDTPTTPDADPLCCWSLLDNTPGDITVTDGNTLTITFDANGILRLSGG